MVTRKVSIHRSSMNPSQWRGIHCRDPYLLFAGGVGSGKTTFLSQKLLQFIKEDGNVPGLVVAPTWPLMKAVTLRRIIATLERAFPGVRPRLRDPSGERFLDLGFGPRIYLRTASNPGSIEGFDVGWALGDELRWWPKLSYMNFIARVRRACALPQIACASTPELGWMSDEFNSGKQGRKLITVPTRENAAHLRPGYIEDLRLSYSKRMQDAILDGLFVLLEGAVYEALAADVWNSPWVVNYDPEENRDLKTYLAFDPGYRKSSWLWLHEVRKCEWVVFDELQLENTSDWSCVERVNARGWPIDEIWCDPAADQTQSALDFDTLDVARGINFRNADDPCIRYVRPPFTSIKFGVDKVRTMLGDPEAGLPIRVKFAKRLEAIECPQSRGIVKSLQNYKYPEEKPDRPVGNNPLKDGVTDHDNDAFRQWVVGMWLTSPLKELDRDIRKRSQGKLGFVEAGRA